MYPAVVQVQPQDDFCLSVVFDDGTRGTLDVKPYLDFGVFQRIRASRPSAAWRVAFDTIQWDCGVDLDPEFVRHKIAR